MTPVISAKPSEYDTLWYYINWLNNGRVFLNRNGEGFSPEYPAAEAVANFCNSGGVYVDYCGWPMWSRGSNELGRFLYFVGADPGWCDGFYRPGWYLCDPFPGYPYPAGWHSRMWLGNPEGKIYADWNAPTDKTACVFGDAYVYSIVGVRANNGGWYFYGFGQQNGDSVPPQEFARFIKEMVGAAVPPPPPPGPTCNPDRCTGTPTLQYGSVNDCVGWVQRKLGITVDCIFGPQTLNAVKNFQAANGLAVDGIVGSQTWAVLKGQAPTPTCPPGTYWDPTTGRCVSPPPPPPPPPPKKDYLPYAVIAGGVIVGGIGLYLIAKGVRS